MTHAEEYKQFIIRCIKKKSEQLSVNLTEINDDFSLTGSGIFDSMDFMNLIVDVENEFKVSVDFSDADPEKFTTLMGFVEYIK
jgi:acyl carrier protein